MRRGQGTFRHAERFRVCQTAELNRLIQLQVTDAASTILQGYTYTLRDSGHRSRVVEANARTVDYIYDDLYRLTQERVSLDPALVNYTADYTLDAAGNRTEKQVDTTLTQSLSFDPNDRLSTDTYDANGNTTAATVASIGVVDTYDFRVRLIRREAGLQIIDLTYDGAGNRVSKTVDGERTDYLVDTNTLTGYAQVVEERSSGTTANAYRYTGEQWDEDLQMVYLRARYLQPETGRFWSRDTYEGRLNEPLTLHKYLYANANPVMFTDPSGLATSGSAEIGVVSNTTGQLSKTVVQCAVKRVPRRTGCEMAEIALEKGVDYEVYLFIDGAGAYAGGVL